MTSTFIQFLLPLAYSALFVYLIGKLRFFVTENISKNSLIFLFLLKIAAGTILWWIYTYHYNSRQSSDIYKYFDDSKIIFDELFHDPVNYMKMITGINDDSAAITEIYSRLNHWYKHYTDHTYNDSRIIIRFNAIARLFSAGNYHVHTVFMSFISFTGLLYLYKAFAPFINKKKKLFAYFIFLSPSILLWSSGVLKEGILFFGLGLLLYQITGKSYTSNKKTNITIILFALFILIFLKAYVLISLLPAIIAYMLSINNRRIALKYLSVLSVTLIIAAFSCTLKPKYNIASILSKKQKDLINIAKGGVYLERGDSLIYLPIEQKTNAIKDPLTGNYFIKPGSPYKSWNIHQPFDTIFVSNSSITISLKAMMVTDRAGSLINTKILKADIKSVLANSPLALINALCRPFIWEADNSFMLLAAIENFFIILLLIYALFRPFRPYHKNEIFLCIAFATTLMIIVGLTTPVIGALVRYKVPGLPLLGALAFMLIDPSHDIKKGQ